VFDYVQLSGFVDAVCCDVICIPLHSVNGMLLYFVCRALNCRHNRGENKNKNSIRTVVNTGSVSLQCVL